ncbi:MAG: glycoside hydrolase family 95 protein, partial [Bacteroidales bacterium]
MNKAHLKSFCITLLSLCSLNPCIAKSKNSLRLWYDRPADVTETDRVMDDKYNEAAWLDALPIGNGFMGAMIYGGTDQERIQLNEKTLWSGSYSDSDNPDAYKNLETIQNLLNNGQFKEGSDLAMNTFKCKGPGSGYGFAAKYKAPYGTFQTLGDLWLDFEQKGAIKNYHRELDLSKGIVRVSYTQGDNEFMREYFMSYPDNAMVIR